MQNNGCSGQGVFFAAHPKRQQALEKLIAKTQPESTVSKLKVRRNNILIAIGDIRVGDMSYKEAIECYTEDKTVKLCHMKFYLYKQRAYAYYMLAEQDKITLLSTGPTFNMYGPHYEIKSIPDSTKGLYQDAMTDCHNALHSLENKKQFSLLKVLLKSSTC